MKKIISAMLAIFICVFSLIMIIPAYANENGDTAKIFGFQLSNVYEKKYDVRFIGIIDDLNYDGVGMEVSAIYNGQPHDKSWESTDLNIVYAKLIANTDTGIDEIKASDYSDNGYFFALTITGVPENAEVEFTLTPFTIAFGSGEKVYGKTIKTDLTGAVVINTAEELQDALNSGDTDGNYVVRATEIDMTGLEYKGLGTSSEPYAGTFDFGNCTLKGLSSPLFPYVAGGTIKNLTIADTSIDIALNGNRYGLIVCVMSTGTLGNITLEDTVEINIKSYVGNNPRVGGIVGIVEIKNGSEGAVVENCTTYATFASAYDNNSSTYIGGIAGSFYGNSANIAAMIMRNCINYGNIINNNTNKESKVGGLIGDAKFANISYCANYGEVSTNEEVAQIGGILGRMADADVAVKYCINGGKISGGSVAGGIAGDGGKARCSVIYCINTATEVAAKTTNAYGAIIGNAGGSGSVFTDCIYINVSGLKGVGNEQGTNISGEADIAAVLIKANETNEMNGVFAIEGGRIVFAK